MGENPYEDGVNNNVGDVTDISDAIKKVTYDSEEANASNSGVYGGADFKVSGTSNLPEKPSFWTKLKNML